MLEANPVLASEPILGGAAGTVLERRERHLVIVGSKLDLTYPTAATRRAFNAGVPADANRS